MGVPRRPLSILFAALGGQGGGVLTEWLVAAATHAGYPVQSTSIPGVAQRTGATTYYVEMFPERRADAPEALDADASVPMFSLYPTAGDVDVVIAGELLEAGRTLEMDYASPDRTTMIASTHRLFAIGEKTKLGNGIFPRERVDAAARALTRRLVAFDALSVARRTGSEVNAVLLGALAATGALPLSTADLEAAIREGGVAVERNLAGLRAGIEIVEGGDAVPPVIAAPWSETRAVRAQGLGRRGPAFLALVGALEAEFPEPLHPTLGECVARLIDYQDVAYAEAFAERVRRVRALDPDGPLSEIFARRLAVWMTYEDAVRVADLKTRRGRFERIRRENGVANGAVVTVTDYLKPDLDEIYGLLPARLGGPIARWAERRWPQGRPTLAQHVRTTSVLGFLRVWMLARLRFLRPSSLRFQREWALIARWERTVLDCAALDRDLAREVAETAVVVKGYGEVRRGLAHALERLLDELVAPAVARDRARGAGYARTASLVREARAAVLDDARGIEAAVAVVAR